jgi:hypothetical protein
MARLQKLLDRRRAPVEPQGAGACATVEILSSARQGRMGNFYNSEAGAKRSYRQVEVLEAVARLATFGFLLAPKKQIVSC